MKFFISLIMLSSVFIGNATASESECTLNITYKNSKEKNIKIDLERATDSEKLYKKLSGSLLIEILVKTDSHGEKKTIISVLEMQTGVKIGTTSDTLLIERDAYKANILCVDEIF